VLPPISWTDRHRAQASGLVWVAKRARPRVPRIGLQPELPVCGRWLFPGKPVFGGSVALITLRCAVFVVADSQDGCAADGLLAQPHRGASSGLPGC
jgi:hypothetical protein